MEKQDIIEKLLELGITTTNCFPKSSFVKNGEVNVGLYEREMMDDFYFFNKYDKKIYKFPKPESISKYELDTTNKYLIPLYECKVVWEDKPYVELLDLPFRDMTLRQYACIHLKVPNSGLDWLDSLIYTAVSKPLPL